LVDERTGAHIRQVTTHPSIHHQPFFFIQAYDNDMRWLFFVSHRTGTPQIFAEDCQSGELIQLTDHPGISEWSVRPAYGGKAVFFTAGTGGWRLDLDTLEERQLVNFAATSMREEGMVAAAMGTTGLSWDDRWWAVAYKVGSESQLAVVDTESGETEIIQHGKSIGHMQFCPDDANILFYAGPLTDRVWLINRDGSNNRRLYERTPGQWVTHETWLPGARELLYVDWPKGIRGIKIDTGAERQVTAFNAWHAACNRQGTLMVADTNFPDIGLQIFNPLDSVGTPRTLCYPEATSQGAHWNGPFPYDKGPIEVKAPQHTHPHPSFSPDSRLIVYTSDVSGYSQVYEIEVPSDLL